MTCRTLVMLFLAMTLLLYYASVMAKSSSSSSLSLFINMYLLILSFHFLWNLLAELILNLLSVLVGLYAWLGLAENFASRE